LARAPVSKTGGWGFETLRPCQPPHSVRRGAGFHPGGVRSGAARRLFEGHAALAKLDPARFVREVRQEVAKVTWPTRKETLITTGLVLGMSALAAVFFLVVDQVIGLAMRGVLGLG
jgi:preprotein translocase subunit SecE